MGLPGDGGWNEVKWNVAIASVALGDRKQGLHSCRRGVLMGGWLHDSFGVNISRHHHINLFSKADLHFLNKL